MTFHPFTRSAVWMILTLALAWLRPPCAAQTEEASDHKTPGGERSYPFPARQDDLNPGEYWYRLKKAHRADIAELAYDLDAIRYDSKENVWTRYNPGVDSNAKVRDTEHSDWIVYGKKVYAIADGEVSGCWRNQPEGPAVGSTDRTAYLRFVGLPQSYFDFIPGAGNHLWVEHDDGSRALYGHFQPESIPTALCPFSETLPAPGENDQTKGNHLWVEHDDGSRALYGHFQPESIPTALCPFSETLPAPGENDQTKIPTRRPPAQDQTRSAPGTRGQHWQFRQPPPPHPDGKRRR